MHTLMQPVTTADYHGAHRLVLVADGVAWDPVGKDLVTVEVIDDWPVVDTVCIESASQYSDGIPTDPTEGGDWTELNGCLRAIISVHVLRMGYSQFVYGRHEVILVPTY